jgi:hypothetical protein
VQTPGDDLANRVVAESDEVLICAFSARRFNRRDRGYHFQ